MLKDKDNTLIKRTEKLLKKKNTHKTGSLYHVAEEMLGKKRAIMELVKKYDTPFYVYDQEALDESINELLAAFSSSVELFRGYYALKLNHHPQVARRVVERGMGLDVASAREIDIALEAGCEDIVYFAPGKTEKDILHALKHTSVLKIHMDSFAELEKVGKLAERQGVRVRAAIRIHTNEHGDWQKYGIALDDLKEFWDKAKRYKHIDLQGVHFHMSRNKDAKPYEQMIETLALYLKKNFSKEDLNEIKYVDFGGGFEQVCAEGYFPQTTPQGSIIKTVNDQDGKKTKFADEHYILEAVSIDEYAKKIGATIKKHLRPLIKAHYYSEPGRYICNKAMHIVLKVEDVKDEKNVILDGGVNMVGWQRYMFEYFPLINLSAPAEKELVCNMWGNLCTTWDIWGYRCYAKSLSVGDVIVVPYQGALTYTLAQSFINPIPPVYKL